MDLISLLLKHEGVRYRPYQDTVGKWTIGCGRNLDDVGISHDEMLYLLHNDIKRVENDCLHAFPWYADLDPTRQMVVASLVFNLGLAGFQKFRKCLAAIEQEDWTEAAAQMRDSKWYRQVRYRGEELAQMMEAGCLGPQ